MRCSIARPELAEMMQNPKRAMFSHRLSPNQRACGDRAAARPPLKRHITGVHGRSCKLPSTSTDRTKRENITCCQQNTHNFCQRPIAFPQRRTLRSTHHAQLQLLISYRGRVCGTDLRCAFLRSLHVHAQPGVPSTAWLVRHPFSDTFPHAAGTLRVEMIVDITGPNAVENSA